MSKVIKLTENKIYEDSDIVIVNPTTIQEMVRYGHNTKWIESKKTENFFEINGGNQGNIRIYYNKKNNKKFLMDIKRKLIWLDEDYLTKSDGRPITELPEWATNVQIHERLSGNNRNKKKVIRLTENDIEKLVKKIINEGKTINEDLPEREQERKDTSFRRREFQPYNREKQIQKLFGKYAEDVPPQVIQYLRKIPGTIVKRLVDIYGYDRIQGYLDKASVNQVQENYNFNEIISEKNKSNKKLDI